MRGFCTNLAEKLYFCTVKAAIKREKTRKDFEIFRAEAVSNEVKLKTMQVYDYTTRKIQAAEAANQQAIGSGAGAAETGGEST